MNVLEFENITQNMQVLYEKDGNVYATSVVSTSLGHPSIQKIRLKGGFVLYYLTMTELTYNKEPIALYADNAVNRTELLLESRLILVDLTGE